jgi:esterase
VTSKLHASSAGKGPPVILLHGLFGAGNNLGAVARSLQDRYRVHCLDLPNHGRSPWLETHSDLADMADCVRDWLIHHGLHSVRILGHSLGGKVAMQLALARPELVEALVVADIAPVSYPRRHDTVFAALDAVAQSGCRSRQEAAQIMDGFLEEKDVIQFLLSSLRREEDGAYRWRFNLEGLKRDYGAVLQAPPAAGPYRGPVLFVKGGQSDYVQASHRSHILALFPKVELKVMPASGHWLHAQQPALFNGIVGRFLDAQASWGDSND